MSKQRRWFCPSCKREWIEPQYIANSSPITITGNKRNDLCPMCGGPDIQFVEFTPKFPGGDIPRPGEEIELPEGINLDEVKETQRPVTAGFIQNNLLEMMREK